MRFVVKFAWVVLVVVLTWDPTLGARQSAREVPQVKRWWNKKKCSNDLPGDGHHYVNKWDGYFAFNCPKTAQSICSVRSVYRECKRDRVWAFKCSYNKAARMQCHWSPYVNDWDKPLKYECPNYGFITGVQSHHDNSKEDRRFKFRCCNHKNYEYRKCWRTHDVNHWKGLMDYSAPQRGKRAYIVGADSYHENRQEDRVWHFKVCELRFKRKSRKSYK